MFSAYLLITGGALGLAVEGLRAVATVEEKLPEALANAYPHWLSAAMAAATLLLGILSLRTQGAVFAYAGAATGMGSLAYAGLVPFMSLLAVIMLIKSHFEGEETRNDGITLHASMWPDKAMSASLFMIIGASVALVQGIAIARGDYDPLVLPNTVGMIVDFVVAGIMLVAAYQVYNLTMPWLGYVAAGVSIFSFALYILGPAIGLVIFLFMRKAERENEFNESGAAPARAKGKSPPVQARKAAGNQARAAAAGAGSSRTPARPAKKR
jgi:hypothetical protein